MCKTPMRVLVPRSHERAHTAAEGLKRDICEEYRVPLMPGATVLHWLPDLVVCKRLPLDSAARCIPAQRGHPGDSWDLEIRRSKRHGL